VLRSELPTAPVIYKHQFTRWGFEDRALPIPAFSLPSAVKMAPHIPQRDPTGLKSVLLWNPERVQKEEKGKVQ
jgi:hypothetical protein